MIKNRTLVSFLFLLLSSYLVAQDAAPLKNPYYSTPVWKNWYEDQSTVPKGEIRGSGYNKDLTIVPEEFRLYPQDVTEAEKADGLYMKFSDTFDPLSPYAGVWRDTFISSDHYHTRVYNFWEGDDGNRFDFNQGNRNSYGVIEAKFSEQLHKYEWGFGEPNREKSLVDAGALYSNQSTSGMGDWRTEYSYWAKRIEEIHFKNTVFTSPAYASSKGHYLDLFRAFHPSHFNTRGASYSVPPAYMKMMASAGYMKETLKKDLIRNGLFANISLNVWKQSLPYKVSPGHESRMRVSYIGSGVDTIGRNYTSLPGTPDIFDRVSVFQDSVFYDNNLHVKNMVDIYKNMDVAPPVAVLKHIGTVGGNGYYAHKTVYSGRQLTNQQVVINVDLSDSLDLQGLPLTYRWELSYGLKNTTVDDLGSGKYRITVPEAPADMVGGRTVLVAFANNGYYDSNPIAINVYRGTNKGDQQKENELSFRAERVLQWPDSVCAKDNLTR